MESYSREELEEALRAISPMLGKCEKALEKLSEGTSQHPLLTRKIKALQISSSFIKAAIDK